MLRNLTLALCLAHAACNELTYDDFGGDDDEPLDPENDPLRVDTSGCVNWCKEEDGSMCIYDPCQACDVCQVHESENTSYEDSAEGADDAAAQQWTGCALWCKVRDCGERRGPPAHSEHTHADPRCAAARACVSALTYLLTYY